MLTLLMMLCGCSSGEQQLVEDAEDAIAVEEGERMPIVITIPATDAATRAPGDPGTRESFPLPEYLYIWVVADYGGGSYDVKYSKHHLNTALWNRITLTSPSYTNGDAAYQYSSDLMVILPKVRVGATGRVFVAVSKYDIDGSNAFYASVPTTQAGVEGITFDVPAATGTDTRSDVIRDIYSSPCNLTLDYPGTSDDYYGTITDFATKQPRINMVLFHVGAKLDLNWNIDEGNRSTLWLQHESDAISVTGLKCKSCYLFKPMQNDAVGADPYTWNISANIGNQWLGREYAYVIPYFNGSSQYPISATVKKVVNSSNGTKTTAMNIEVAGYASYVFTPWLIGKITVDNTTAP